MPRCCVGTLWARPNSIRAASLRPQIRWTCAHKNLLDLSLAPGSNEIFQHSPSCGESVSGASGAVERLAPLPRPAAAASPLPFRRVPAQSPRHILFPSTWNSAGRTRAAAEPATPPPYRHPTSTTTRLQAGPVTRILSPGRANRDQLL